ncbi:hypothetical protein DERP_008953 [Dermatophagoides pteronyssinus]|uniref:Uncharacterized protein n=1 Tax=Dermatophagoides pteronyssinus TaxID=6956 RepID=A0ABQ8JG34_DERPT|nr:hypothetical protein DERP_008953 [Dermatophagoides pteronyssinus]
MFKKKYMEFVAGGDGMASCASRNSNIHGNNFCDADDDDDDVPLIISLLLGPILPPSVGDIGCRLLSKSPFNEDDSVVGIIVGDCIGCCISLFVKDEFKPFSSSIIFGSKSLPKYNDGGRREFVVIISHLSNHLVSIPYNNNNNIDSQLIKDNWLFSTTKQKND